MLGSSSELRKKTVTAFLVLLLQQYLCPIWQLWKLKSGLNWQVGNDAGLNWNLKIETCTAGTSDILRLYVFVYVYVCVNE